MISRPNGYALGCVWGERCCGTRRIGKTTFSVLTKAHQGPKSTTKVEKEKEKEEEEEEEEEDEEEEEEEEEEDEEEEEAE